MQAPQAAGGAPPTEGIHALAQEGIQGSGSPLPALDEIQASFGHHDVNGIAAHIGGPAAGAAEAMAAEAYATGDQVAFRQSPDLHTQAHEAAHVVQQRGGVQLKGGVGDPSDQYERNADEVADRVVRGQSAEDLLDPFAGSSTGGGSALQRRSLYGGALIPEDELADRGVDRADVFLGPISFSVVGDPFVVRLSRQGDRLAATVSYIGSYPVDATEPGTLDAKPASSIVLKPDERSLLGVVPTDSRRPYRVRLLSRGPQGVTFDLYGDGGHILEIQDRCDDGDLLRFDRRNHFVTAKLNGFPSYPGTLSIHLPAEGGTSTDPRERVASTALDLNGDSFTLRARRHGASDRVVLSFAHIEGSDQLLVPFTHGADQPVTVGIVRNDGRHIDIDLSGDGEPDVSLIHTVLVPGGARRQRGYAASLDAPFLPGGDDDRFYVHNLAAYDPGGVKLGTMVRKIAGYAGYIPPEQDAIQSPAPDGAAMPGDREPVQGDVPGQTPLGTRHTAGDWELRVDGDGDRTKEVLLRFAPKPSQPGQAVEYAFSVTQLSSGATAELSFTLSAEQARSFQVVGPELLKATDGRSPNTIKLGSDGALLEFGQQPGHGADRTAYGATIAGYSLLFSLPRETRETAWLTDIEDPSRTRTVADIETVDVELSEYRDRFRLTAEKVDGGDVLLGISALGPQGPVGGFSTRLKGIKEPRLDRHADLPTQISFYVLQEWGRANLHMTSALDPPRDSHGRLLADAPPSAHRDHRISLHGVVEGEPSHTFRVRNGHFVGGWAKSKDNRHAAGAAQAVGILDEQAKHPSIAEFRVQIDGAIDAEVHKAVKRGWIDGLTADAWSSLTENMVFVQAQLGAGNIDSDRAGAAAMAAEYVGSWLAETSHDKAPWTFHGSERRLAPGEAAKPGRDPITGKARNPYTGATWNVDDGAWTGEISPGFATQTASHLEDAEYERALRSYQKLRDGVGRWLGKRFELDPKFGKDSPEATRLTHLCDLSEQIGEIDNVQANMLALDRALDAEVASAAERGLLSETTLDAWTRLKEDMVLIAGSTTSGEADSELLKRADNDASTIDTWLTEDTADQNVLIGTIQGNPYTNRIDSPWSDQVRSDGDVLRAHLQDGQFMLAAQAYRRLRNGVVKWIAEKTKAKYGELSDEYKQIDGLQDARHKTRDVQRVPATFIADDSYETMPDKGDYKQKDFGKYKQVPLQLFVWAENGKWRVRDLLNAKAPFKAEVDFDGGAEPPESLFEALDHKKHLPKGYIHYHLPSGRGGRVRCDAEKDWYDHVRDIALVLAAVGLAFLTLGALTPLAVGTIATVAFSASMVLGAAAAGGEIADALDHGYADGQLIMLNVLDIVSSIASLGAMAGGKLAMGGARAATAAKQGTGAAWTGPLAHMARGGQLAYKPLLLGSVVTDGVSLLVMTDQLLNQMGELDKIKDPHQRQMAKAQLLTQFAVTGGLVILSIRGDMPDLSGKSPNIVLDKMNGITVARLADVNLGKTKVKVADGDANMGATARWQTQDIEYDAQHGSAKDKERADELIGDPEFQGYYARWMQQPNKIKPGRGRPVVLAPEGAPPAVVKRLQDMVDSGDLVLYERAFESADAIARIRAEADAHDLDIDPTNLDTWPSSRAKLVEVLGGGRRAERMVTRYEAARLGAEGNIGRFADERARINQVLPDSELERIQALYPEHEVYMTTPRAGTLGGERLEIAVVVRNGTDPDVMHALEQRVYGHEVYPRSDSAGGGASGQDQTAKPMSVRAKVMTEDQFFGMATAAVPGRGAPRYHRLGQDFGSALDLGPIEVRPQGDGRYSIDPENLTAAHATWKGSDRATSVSKIKYDADTGSMYFEIRGRGRGAALRIEAALPGRITSAGDWQLSNRIVGTRTLGSVGEGHDVLRAIVAGDTSVITRALGVPLPKGFNTDDGLEFGLGQLPDGRFVIIRGELGAVDWSTLPGVKAIAHTHPSTRGNDLLPDEVGLQRVPLAKLAEATDVPLLNRSVVFPSPEDVHFSSHHGLSEHRVITSFAVKDGMVMKPDDNWLRGDARLEFRIVGASEVGRIGADGLPVHQARIVGVFEGREVLHTDVFVTPANSKQPDGMMYMKEPPGFVRTVQADTRARRSSTGGVDQPEAPSVRETQRARHWGQRRAHSNPNKMTKEEIDAALDEYGIRREHVWNLYQQAKTDPSVLPDGITHERMRLAVEGDPTTGTRVPLNFGTDPAEATRLFEQFKAELKAAFEAEGITDAVVVQLGSGTTGWSTAPGMQKDGVTPKLGKKWTAKSDADFAIFSDQALIQAREANAPINPKNQQAGEYTTLRNDPAINGFYSTPLGKRLDALARDWNQRIYNDPEHDGFDFKLNLKSDNPFSSAVPVLQSAPTVEPLHGVSRGGGTRAIEIEGRAPYLGVPMRNPRVVPSNRAMGRKEFHITVLSPPELASLSPEARTRLANGVNIAGRPQPGEIIVNDIAGASAWQLEIHWPEAQRFRAELGLPAKKFHISLTGGIGDAVAKREELRRAAAADAMADD